MGPTRPIRAQMMGGDVSSVGGFSYSQQYGSMHADRKWEDYQSPAGVICYGLRSCREQPIFPAMVRATYRVEKPCTCRGVIRRRVPDA